MLIPVMTYIAEAIYSSLLRLMRKIKMQLLPKMLLKMLNKCFLAETFAVSMILNPFEIRKSPGMSHYYRKSNVLEGERK